MKRFKGEDSEKSNLENSETFANNVNANEEAWQSEIEKFDAIMSEWGKAIESADESKFAQEVSAENQSPWAEVIGLINTHSSYHGGQIVLIRKVQGSWDANQGVS